MLSVSRHKLDWKNLAEGIIARKYVQRRARGRTRWRSTFRMLFHQIAVVASINEFWWNPDTGGDARGKCCTGTTAICAITPTLTSQIVWRWRLKTVNMFEVMSVLCVTSHATLGPPRLSLTIFGGLEGGRGVIAWKRVGCCERGRN
jgi:hypothetical protein